MRSAAKKHPNKTAKILYLCAVRSFLFRLANPAEAFLCAKYVWSDNNRIWIISMALDNWTSMCFKIIFSLRKYFQSSCYESTDWIISIRCIEYLNCAFRIRISQMTNFDRPKTTTNRSYLFNEQIHMQNTFITTLIRCVKCCKWFGVNNWTFQ